MFSDLRALSMANGYGPISDGIRKAIFAAMDKGMTAYKIAAQARLSPSQLYRFLNEDPTKRRGLSLEALDRITTFLELELRPRTIDVTVVNIQALPGSLLVPPATPYDLEEPVNNVAEAIGENHTNASLSKALAIGTDDQAELTAGEERGEVSANDDGPSVKPLRKRRIGKVDENEIVALIRELAPQDPASTAAKGSG